MSKIHAITHPEPLVAKKVNFFADTFVYLTSAMGTFEGLTIENHVSLVEKAITLLESTDSRPHQYLKNYFDHPYLQRDDRFVKELRSFKVLFDLIDDYKKYPIKRRAQWIESNLNFLPELKRFRKALKRKIIKWSLKEIISFLRCVHDLDHHKDDLIYDTKILINEFLLNGHSKREMQKVFDKIMSRDLFEFPFPKNVKTEEQRNEFMSTRTFDQQFNGLYNLLKGNADNYYFLYRIYGLKANEDFSLPIGKVTFYHPAHSKLKQIVLDVKQSPVMPEFFDGKNFLIGVTKIKYYSLGVGEWLAVRRISDELDFLNYKLKSNGHIEKYSYVKTKDFKTYSGEWGSQEKYTPINKSNLGTLRENPARFLRNVNVDVRSRLVENEPLYRKAMVTRDIEDYWQYFDAVIPHDEKGKDQIINIVSSVVLLLSEQFSKPILEREIRGSLAYFNIRSEVLGMSPEEHLAFHKKLYKKRNISRDRTLNKLEHPFIKSLLSALQDPWSSKQYSNAYDAYQRILIDARAQRNSVVHKGKGDYKSLSALNYSLPWLTSRFRSAMARALKTKKFSSLEEAIEDAKKQAQMLMQGNKN